MRTTTRTRTLTGWFIHCMTGKPMTTPKDNDTVNVYGITINIGGETPEPTE